MRWFYIPWAHFRWRNSSASLGPISQDITTLGDAITFMFLFPRSHILPQCHLLSAGSLIKFTVSGRLAPFSYTSVRSVASRSPAFLFPLFLVRMKVRFWLAEFSLSPFLLSRNFLLLSLSAPFMYRLRPYYRRLGWVSPKFCVVGRKLKWRGCLPQIFQCGDMNLVRL